MLNHGDAIDVLRKLLNRTQLFGYDFPHGPVTVTLKDGSFFCWYAAFVIADTSDGQVYVFTEHYGYHAFEGEFVVFYGGPITPKKQKIKGLRDA